MTKQEAIELMKKGEKITHDLFSPKEWMTMVGLNILLEDGVVVDESEFWKYRQQAYWNEGYSIFKSK